MKTVNSARNADHVKHEDVTYLAVQGVLAVITVINNGIVLVAFYRKRLSKKPVLQYIVSMAVADFLFGFVSVPLALLSSKGIPKTRELCLVSISLQIMTVGFTIMALLATVSIQFLSIVFPLYYQRKWTSYKSIVHILIKWGISFVIGILPLLGWNNKKSECYFLEIVPPEYTIFLLLGVVFPSTVVMIMFYIGIYLAFHKSMRMKKNDETARRRRVRTSFIIFLNLILFMICWLPLYILDTISIFDSRYKFDVRIINALIIMRSVRCALNPILYAYHLDEVKSAIGRMFVYLKCRYEVTDTSADMTPSNKQSQDSRNMLNLQ